MSADALWMASPTLPDQRFIIQMLLTVDNIRFLSSLKYHHAISCQATMQCSCRWSAQNRWRFWADLTFCWHRPYLSWILIGKTRKNNVFFRPSPERGGEGRPLPNFMAHFYHVLISKIRKFYPKPFIFVCYLVICCHHYHQNYHHNYHFNRDYHNWYF